MGKIPIITNIILEAGRLPTSSVRRLSRKEVYKKRKIIATKKAKFTKELNKHLQSNVASETYSVYQNVIHKLKNYHPPKSMSDYMKKHKIELVSDVYLFLIDETNKQGMEQLASRFQSRATDVNEALDTVMYASQKEDEDRAITLFYEIVKGEKLSISEYMEIDQE